MSKRIVFVSVPMSGRDDDVVNRQIQITKHKYLQKNGIGIREVAFVDNLKACKDKYFADLKTSNLGYLSNAIKLLANCDEAIFGEGWQKARGCMVEMMTCKLYGIKTETFDDEQ